MSAKSQTALVLAVLLGGVVPTFRASRVNIASHSMSDSDFDAEGTCVISENDVSLHYGVHASFPVKHCTGGCGFNIFMLERKYDAIPDPESDGIFCKCSTTPKFWEKNPEKLHWFQFRTSKNRMKCDKQACWQTFVTWANLFLKQIYYPKPEARISNGELVDSQNGYDWGCSDAPAEGIIFPSPLDKVRELKLRIERETDPEKKAELQAQLDSILAALKHDAIELEVYGYDELDEWGPEMECNTPDVDCAPFQQLLEDAGDKYVELVSFSLKPCKDQNLQVKTEFAEIMEECGMPELGTQLRPLKVSLKELRRRIDENVGPEEKWELQTIVDNVLNHPSMGAFHYHVEDAWGPEISCEEQAEPCQAWKEAGQIGELQTYRMKPCRVKDGETLSHMGTILEECGKPQLGASVLPVRVSVSKHFDPGAPADEPCK